jgi:epoxyqueuosine reductase
METVQGAEKNGLRAEIDAYAREIGVDLVGVTTPDPFERLLSELDRRNEHYRARYAYRLENWRKFARPADVLPGAKSVLVIGFYYLAPEAEEPGLRGRMGRIVAYGHMGILLRVRKMRKFLEDRGYAAVPGVHRKEAAVRAGLGSLGKHNLVINPKYGSWVAYQAIATDAPLAPDRPSPGDVCGDCTLCMRNCPTGALYEPRRVDPRKCVTCLLTSQNVAMELLPAMGTYILGCDACQEACPRNRNLTPKPEVESLLPKSMGVRPALDHLLNIDEKTFQKEVIGHIQNRVAGNSLLSRVTRHPVLLKAAVAIMKVLFKGKEVLPETFVHASGKLEVYRRNAIVACGNLRDRSSVEMIRKFENDAYLGPYARWALDRING